MGPPQGPSIVIGALLSLAAVGGTVWTVLAILAGAEFLVDVLILATIVLWTFGLLVLMNLDGLYWAPRRAQSGR